MKYMTATTIPAIRVAFDNLSGSQLMMAGRVIAEDTIPEIIPIIIMSMIAAAIRTPFTDFLTFISLTHCYAMVLLSYHSHFLHYNKFPLPIKGTYCKEFDKKVKKTIVNRIYDGLDSSSSIKINISSSSTVGTE